MRTLALLASLALALGCDDREGALTRPLGTEGPYATRHHAVWLVPGMPALALFEPARLDLSFVALPGEAFSEPDEEGPVEGHFIVAPDQEGVLILHREWATWLPIPEGKIGAPTAYDVGVRYARAAFAPDGARVVLHHEPGNSTSSVLSNPNQIAILDLAEAPSDGNPVKRTLKSFGAEPRRLVVGDKVELAGRERQLAWALADRYLAVFDLLAPEAEERVVHLTLAGDASAVEPTEVVFADIEGDYTAFIRSAGADDLFSLTFPDPADADEVPRPYLNQLPAGNRPSALAALEVADGPRLFALNPSTATLSVIHPVTGRRTAVELGYAANQLIPFTAPRADQPDEEGHFALCAQVGARAAIFVDLDQVELRRGRALTVVPLGEPLAQLLPLPGRRGAVARLGQSKLALIDFDAQTATPLSAGGLLNDLTVDPDLGRVYATVNGASFSVVELDVDTGTPSSVRVPSGQGQLLLIPGARRLVLDHGGELGNVTVVPADEADPDKLVERSGLLLEGVLDR